MTEILVKTRYARIAPRKVRILARNFVGKQASLTAEQLSFHSQKGARFLRKLLLSGIAAAKDKKLETENLVIRSLRVDEGPAFKRRLLGSRGRATVITKKTSHLSLTLTTPTEMIKKPKNPMKRGAPPPESGETPIGGKPQVQQEIDGS